MSPLSQGTLKSRLRAGILAAGVGIVGISVGLLGYMGYAPALTPNTSVATTSVKSPNTDWSTTNDPWTQIQQFHDSMDKLFANTFNQAGIANDRLGYAVPNMDLRDAKDHYEVVMDMPGTDKNTIKVYVNGGLLSVSGQRNTSDETKQGNQVIRSERSSAQFERVVSLPGPVNAAGLKSNYTDGVLTITIPKANEGAVATSPTPPAPKPESSPSVTSTATAAPPDVNATPFATDDPWNQLEQFHNSMDQLFANTFAQSDLNGLIDQAQDFTAPAMDLQDHKDQYEVRMDMPGTDKGTIKVNIEGRFLTVSGQRNVTDETKNGAKVVRSERAVTEFDRTIGLPGPVRVNAVDAKYENGVLTINLPKADQIASATQIPVH